MKGSKKEFIAESEEIIAEVEKGLLALLNAFNPDTLNSVFRSIHTLKGLSGLFGLKNITDLSHTLESLLDDLRLGKIEFTKETINFIFSNIDILKNLIGQASTGKEVADISKTLQAIESFREKAKSKLKGPSLESYPIDPSIIKVLSEYEEHRLRSSINEGKGIYQVKAVFDLTIFDKLLESVSSKLKEIGEIIATLPSSTGVPAGKISFMLLFASTSNTNDIKKLSQDFSVEEVIPPRGVSEPAVKSQETYLKSTTNTVRVDIGKLDRILNTVGELVLAKGAVSRIGKELAESFGYAALTLDVHKISQTLERRLAELQDQILEIRMVPIGQIFTRLAQVVRRYTMEIGKEIDLELFGEETEIDKLLAEEVIDPLLHLIRNAIDHGIEPPDVRKASGKKEKGTITLRAFPKGNHVIIEVHDDGAGIDMNKVLLKARERKLIPEEQVLSKQEIIDLIFLPGLSTKAEVSEVSGRGVGMDVVKNKIAALGGFVDVETEVGKGAVFILTLPITLVIIKALLVNVSGETFAIPIASVAET
ncbi:MAG: chemotaxis protein CheA, partial [Nitrospirae bacterium]|nr:chemotaxis protein CheA [Nitrospirota bacterium]